MKLLRHPIYRREKARLGVIRAWHWAILALGLLTILLLLFRLMLCGRGTLPVMSLILAQEALKQIMCLGAGMLGGAAARSDDVGGDDLLRMTPLATRTVVAAKLGAVLQRLWLPIALITLARLAILILTLDQPLPIICYVLMPLPAQAFPPIAPDATDAVKDIWQGHLNELIRYGTSSALLVWASYFTLQPALDAALFGAAGLAAGAATRRRSAGRIAAALGLSAALWIGGYLALNLITPTFALKPRWSARRPAIVLYIGEDWVGNGVFFGYLPLNLWTAGIPAIPYNLVLQPYRLMILIGGVMIVKLGLLAWLLRIAERGSGERG